MKKFVLAALAICLVSPAAAHADTGCSTSHTATHHKVRSFDGTLIAVTEFQPANTGGTCGTVPIILTLHGWGGSRYTTVSNTTVARFLNAGYAVIGIDSRGNGDSGGRSLVHHPQREVQDFRAVLDFIHDNFDYVTKENSGVAKDVVAGSIGGSYGGGFQLMTAAFDDRLDAIAPDIAWGDLTRSLAPNSAPKSVYLAALYGTGKTTKDYDPRLDQWFIETMATNRVPAAAHAAFTEASPVTWIQNIDVPALITQGMPDGLFPFEEGLDNALGIANNGQDVWLRGHNGGHVLPGIQPTGVNGAPGRGGSNSCGVNTADMELVFFDHFLKGTGPKPDMPRFQIPTEQDSNTCVTGDTWPLSTAPRTVEFPAVVAPSTAGSILLPLFTADDTTDIAGLPRIEANTPIELDDIFYASLVLKTAAGSVHVVNDQVMPFRADLASPEGTIAFDLHGVGTRMKAGDELFLKLDGLNEQYALNFSRKPGAQLLTNVRVSIPVV